MPRPEARGRHAGPLALVVAVVLTGCADDTSDGAGGALTAAAQEQTAIAVPGVASCAELPQRASADGIATDRLPPLQLPCLTPGPSIDLSGLSGGPVIVNLWASWCGPCREEMPVLQAAHERYGERVQFLGVDTKDTTDSAADFLGVVGVTYPQVADADGELLNHLGLPGLPVTVALDPDGRVVDTHVGQLDTESIDDLITSVLP